MSAKKSLREELAKWRSVADQLDKERQASNAYLAAVIMKFGGSVILSKGDSAPITKNHSVAYYPDQATETVTLRVVVTSPKSGNQG